MLLFGYERTDTENEGDQAESYIEGVDGVMGFDDGRDCNYFCVTAV
jgi:hypothetical protein